MIHPEFTKATNELSISLANMAITFDKRLALEPVYLTLGDTTFNLRARAKSDSQSECMVVNNNPIDEKVNESREDLRLALVSLADEYMEKLQKPKKTIIFTFHLKRTGLIELESV